MGFIKELTPDEDSEKSLNQERLILEVAERLYEHMTELGLKSTDIGRKLGKGRSFISQVFSGDRNITLRTLADFAWAMDSIVQVKLTKSDANAVLDYKEWVHGKEWRKKRVISNKATQTTTLIKEEGTEYQDADELINAFHGV